MWVQRQSNVQPDDIGPAIARLATSGAFVLFPKNLVMDDKQFSRNSHISTRPPSPRSSCHVNLLHFMSICIEDEMIGQTSFISAPTASCGTRDNKGLLSLIVRSACFVFFLGPWNNWQTELNQPSTHYSMAQTICPLLLLKHDMMHGEPIDQLTQKLFLKKKTRDIL